MANPVKNRLTARADVGEMPAPYSTHPGRPAGEHSDTAEPSVVGFVGRLEAAQAATFHTLCGIDDTLSPSPPDGGDKPTQQGGLLDRLSRLAVGGERMRELAERLAERIGSE